MNRQNIKEDIGDIAAFSHQVSEAIKDHSKLFEIVENLPIEIKEKLYQKYKNTGGPITSIRRELALGLKENNVDRQKIIKLFQTGKVESPKQFTQYKNLFAVLYPFVIAQNNDEVYETIELIAKSLIKDLDIEDITSFKVVGFDGARNTGSDHAWFAIYNNSHPNQKTAKQLFFSIYDGRITYALYDRLNDKIEAPQEVFATTLEYENILSYYRRYIDLIRNDIFENNKLITTKNKKNMPDPICRWRNPFLNHVTELISILPKEELLQQTARDIVNATSHISSFYTTPYQLACQLGLYYESNGRYFPKFTHTPTEQEVLNYLENWIKHYSVPNPYTRGFNDLQQPLSVHGELSRRLLENQAPIEWINTTTEIFNTAIGNEDILRNSINTYSSVLSITDGMIVLKVGKSYEDLAEYIEVDKLEDRDDKEYFFDLFPLLTNSEEGGNENTIETQADQTIITQVRNAPNLTRTEKQQIISARIGQGIFRRNLIADCNICAVTEVDDTNLLIASHIKPWRSSNNEERVNHKNGILLTPTYDKLFDKGLISFTNDGELIISSLISEQNRQRFNLVIGTVYDRFPLEGREEFLQFHREHIFRD